MKIRSSKAEEAYSSDNRFDAIIDVLWGFRFKEAASVAVIDNKKKIEVACYHSEEEALAFFKKHYPNSSDFTWVNRHEKTPIYLFSSKDCVYGAIPDKTLNEIEDATTERLLATRLVVLR